VKVVGPQLLARLRLLEPAALGDNPLPARLILPIRDKPALLAFTDAGRVALLRWEFAGQQPGALDKFLPDGMNGEQVVGLIHMPKETYGRSIGLLNSDGRFKRLALEEFQNLSSRAASVMKLKEGVTLQQVVLCNEGDDLLVGSCSGRLLKVSMSEEIMPAMGRNSHGIRLMRMLPTEVIVGAVAVDAKGTILMGSRDGRLKLIDARRIRQSRIGDVGQIGLSLNSKGDALVGLCDGRTSLITILISDGRNQSLGVNDVKLLAESGAEVYLDLELKESEKIAQLVCLHT